MKEINSIVRNYDELFRLNKRCALATVVHIEGSSYRRPGARMLISEDGRLTGGISGGCLEGDALRKALNVIYQQKPNLVTYDTMDEEEAAIGIGLGCNGIIHVLIEPILNFDDHNPIGLLKKAISKRQAGVLITMFSLENKKWPDAGTKFYISESEVDIETGLQTLLAHQLVAKQVLNDKVSVWKSQTTEQGEVTVFYDYTHPPIQLIIVGAGNDVLPLVNMAEILGWNVHVLDGRPAYANTERFSPTCQVTLAKPEQVLDQVNIDDKTFFALMTHNYNYDKSLLHLLCKKGIQYVAMIGPKKKLYRMLEDYVEEFRPLSTEEISTVYCPAGIDIGSETSEEIALSIISEIQAFYYGKKVQNLKFKTTGIHD